MFEFNLDELRQTFARGLLPEEKLTVDEWADKYRMLFGTSSAEPGRFDTNRTPYMREIMQELSISSATQRVVFKKSAQVGGTETMNNSICYIVDVVPAPTLVVYPSLDDAKNVSKTRIGPMLSETPRLEGKVASNTSRDKSNTQQLKEFAGGYLKLVGANSAKGLRSAAVRFLLMDEVDGYPLDVDGEGDPIVLAEKRTNTYGKKRKVFLISTPTLKGFSRIDREYLNSDQRQYHVPCPHCHEMQVLNFENLSWPKGKPEQAKYQCEHCEELIPEYRKTQMLEQGEWIAGDKGDGITIGFHINALYSPYGWYSWGEAAREYEEALKNPEKMKSFVNTVLGEPYEEASEAPEWEELYAKRETYKIGTVPKGVCFLTAGVDVQRDRIECEIVGWGRNKESWSISYEVKFGKNFDDSVKKQLDEILHTSFPVEGGGSLPIQIMAIDSGDNTQEVYSYVKDKPQPSFASGTIKIHEPRTVIAIKGTSNEIQAVRVGSKIQSEKLKKKSMRLWLVGGPVIKGETYGFLKKYPPTEEALQNGELYPYGYCHFPEYKEDVFKGLVAEQLVIGVKNGRPHAVWKVKPNERNEPLDCRVYARSAAYVLGLDSMTDRQFAAYENRLEKQRKEEADVKKKESKKVNKLAGVFG